MTERQVTIPNKPLVVGSVATLNHLACLQPIELPQQCDLLEIRLDGMAGHEEALQIELDRFTEIPLLFTARAANEGGLMALSTEERSELLLSVADRATWIDVELASYDDMHDAIHRIRMKEVGLILSYHNFEETPEEFALQRTIDLAEEADIIKLAVMHHGVEDFARCTRLLKRNDHPMSFMGMGQLGAVSRLLYAQHGSLLNYGYLGDEPTAPGQWPAKMLKDAIAALDPIVWS
ncbi:3-dehydroquinase [Oceaniferula spumae]|uniref:3-dehydroquinate dehydratase n=1 Tax=Oceaniferula spumae TaxID=2979115 RepID=A0AAT9FL76_9BACT